MLDAEEYKKKAFQQRPDATTYDVLTSDPTPKLTRAIQKTLDRLVREEVLHQTTGRVMSPKETSGHSYVDQNTAFPTPDNFWGASRIPT